MKTTRLIVIALFLSFTAQAQTVYHDASAFPLLGKISEATETRYERLPAKLKGTSRDPVWELGKNTAGLAIRFCSNSQRISVKWETLHNGVMNHMAQTGSKGLDLYCLENGTWTYVNTARPTGKKSEATLISNMVKKERELMLYLPLYDGIVSLEIGIDSLAYIGLPKVDLPSRSKPVVVYGTSITQGGCASRTGMAHTNILSRRLNREIINLGFSGNGLLDEEIAELMAECDASLYIIEYGNCTAEQITGRTEKFYRILRNKRPDTPVIFLENPEFTHIQFDLATKERISERNKALQAVFNDLKAKKEKNIWLIHTAGHIGTDSEATVDGVHLTDLGFLRHADFMYPKIKKIICSSGNNNTPPPGSIRVATTCVKLRLGSKSTNLTEILALIDKTADACQPDIIVLSESVFTRGNSGTVSNSTDDTGITEELTGPVFEALKRKAVERKCYIAFNLNAPRENETPRKFYNSNFIISPEGKMVGRYDKNRLPEGEIKSGLSEGTERPVFDLSIRGMKVKAGMAICFDLANEAYSEGEERVVKSLTKKGATLILVSTIGDFTSEAVRDAKDNGVYVVVSGQDKYREDDFGASAIIDPKGDVLVQFTDRTGLPNQPYEIMRYRKGVDGSFGFVDVKI